MVRQVRSLAEIEPGQAVTVRRILFECLRRQCGELGLHEGDRLSLGGWRGEAILVRTGEGASLRCPTELARFVEVVQEGPTQVA
jgi:hypothetical protein